MPSPVYGLDGPFIRSLTPPSPPVQAPKLPSSSEGRPTPLRYQAIFRSHSQSKPQTSDRKGGAAGPSPENNTDSQQISGHNSDSSFLRFSLARFPLPPALRSGTSQEETEGGSSTLPLSAPSSEGDDVFDAVARMRDSADIATSDLNGGFELVSPPITINTRPSIQPPPRFAPSPRSTQSSPPSPSIASPTSNYGEAQRSPSSTETPNRSIPMVRENVSAQLNPLAGVPASLESAYRSGLTLLSVGGAVPYGRYATNGTEITSFIGGGGVSGSPSSISSSKLAFVFFPAGALTIYFRRAPHRSTSSRPAFDSTSPTR